MFESAEPWTLVEANDKPYARIKVRRRTICERRESALGR